MNQVSRKIELNDRTLWFDGSTSVTEEHILQLIAEHKSLDHIFIKKIVPSVEQYNKLVPFNQQIHEKTNVNDIVVDWNIPTEFKQLDVEEYVYQKLDDELDRQGWSKLAYPPTVKTRVDEELELYTSLGLIDVLRALIYVINTLQNNDIVWGVGRGSSVSSYVLYLIGVHDVDSIKYELDFRDFLRSTE